jgi:hypothetical protein
VVVAQVEVAQEIIQAAQVVQAVALLERMVLAEHWYQEVQLLLLVKATLAERMDLKAVRHIQQAVVVAQVQSAVMQQLELAVSVETARRLILLGVLQLRRDKM